MATRIPTTRTGALTPTSVPAAVQTARAPETDRGAYLPPRRPNANFIPSGEQIAELVTRARAALSRGIYWDRGSIINVLL